MHQQTPTGVVKEVAGAMEEATVDTVAVMEAMVVTEAMEAGDVKEVAGAGRPSLHNLCHHLLEEQTAERLE